MSERKIETTGLRPVADRNLRNHQIIQSITEFAIIVTDRDGLITDWNPGAEHILGWTLVEMIGQTVDVFFTPEDLENGQIAREMRLSLDTGRGIDERWHLRKDGTRFWSSGEMMPLHDDAGSHTGFVKVLRDRTEQHEQGLALEVSRHALVQSERKWRGLFESLQEGFLLGQVVRDESGRIVDWRYEEVNSAWSDLVGIPADQAVGRTIREVIPGVEDEWVNEFADVVETGKAIRFTRQVGALNRWYDGLVQPVGSDRFSVIFLEVTERVRSEARSNALSELSETLATLNDPVAMSSTAARIIGTALGIGRVGYGIVADDGETFTVPSDWTAEGFPSLAGVYRMDDYGGYANDLRQGRTVVIPDIRRDPRTSADTGPLESVGVRSLINYPVVESGKTVAVLYVNDDRVQPWTNDEVAFVQNAASRTRDMVERRRAEASLKASEERQRLAIASGEVGIFDLDMASGELAWDDGVRAAFGVAPDRIVNQAEKLSAVHPDDRASFDAAFAQTMQGSPFDLQFRTIGLDDRQVRWVNVQGRVVGSEGSRHFIGAVRDVSQRVAAEQRQTVLNHELAHRLKNTLAVVQSIATQTLRNAPDMATARDSLTKRIQTLSKAHDVLLTGQSDAGSVEAIIRGAIDLHDPDGRIVLRGAELLIGPKAALTLALIMHELATNAAKYGALSVPEGKVHVAWVVDIDEATKLPTLALSWREIDGPPASPPVRKGFGTRLIEMGLSGSAGGSVDLDYADDGLKCRIVAPLTELQADDDA